MTAQPAWRQPPNLCSVFLGILLVAIFVLPFGDLDFAMLIRLGELIVRTGELRPPESFSYTIHGRDVPDFEWLFEVVIWAIWTPLGYGGLKLLQVLLVSATLVTAGWRLQVQGVRWHGIGLFMGLAVVVLAPSWNLRPLYFTTLGLLLVSGWLHDHCAGRKPLPWWLPLYMMLWANIHPGVITGQGLLVGAIVWEWLNRWLKLQAPLSVRSCLRLTWMGSLGLAASLVSPDPIGCLLCAFQPEVRHPIMRIFAEMQPLHQAALEPPYIYMLVYLLTAVVAVTVVLRFQHYRLWEIALLLGVTGLASMALRSVQDMVLVLIAVGVPHVAPLLRQWARAGRRRPWVVRLLNVDNAVKRMLLSWLWRWQWFWPALVLLVLTLVALTPPLSRLLPIPLKDRYPSAAVDWLEETSRRADYSVRSRSAPPWRIFGPPDYGSYLVWRLGDRVQVYADTRGFCYPPELLEDSHYLPQLPYDWRERLQRVLDRYPTEYFLLETDGPRSLLWHKLKRYRSTVPLYRDNQCVLLHVDKVREALLEMQAEAGVSSAPAAKPGH